MPSPSFNPRTGISTYQEDVDLETLLSAPSASAATAPAPTVAPTVAAPAAAVPGMFAPLVAPAAPIGGWRWGQDPSKAYTDYNEGSSNLVTPMGWLWDDTLAESQGYWDFNDGQNNYVAPPPAPTGQIVARNEAASENSSGGTTYVDSGSGLQATPEQVQQYHVAQQAAADARVPNVSHLPPEVQWDVAMRVHRGLGVEALARAYKLGKFSSDLSPGPDESLGRFIAARQAEYDDTRGFDSHINDWVNTDVIHLENVLESWQEDPERAIFGINTPLESELWGEVLGKDYDANMNMYGGPNEASYQESAEAGNDPRFRAWGQGAAESIGTAALGAWAGGTTFGQTALGQGTIGAARTGLAAANGGNKEAMRSAIVSALIQQGVDVAAPHVAKAINDALASMGGDPVAEVGLSAQGMLADAPATDAVKRFSMPPAGSTPMTGEFAMPAAIPTSTAEQAASTLGSPAFLPGYEAAYGSGMLSGSLTPEQEVADAENLQTLEAGDTPPAVEEPTVTGQDVTKYAKLSKTLYDMLNPDSPSGEGDAPAPADAPQRDEETTDEQYAEQLATYANLDPAAMAEQGLTAGTPEYYEYIMTQMDSIIAQALEGVDVDAADLADQLRAKTAEEMKALERALFVRGQMAQLMGSGTYVDPATGLDEEVVAPDGKQVNPARAAYMRGIARNADKLGRLRGGGAREFIGGMLDRDVDFYGMQGRADERAELEEQYLLEEERKRRRGMFGMGF